MCEVVEGEVCGYFEWYFFVVYFEMVGDGCFVCVDVIFVVFEMFLVFGFV